MPPVVVKAEDEPSSSLHNTCPSLDAVTDHDKVLNEVDRSLSSHLKDTASDHCSSDDDSLKVTSDEFLPCSHCKESHVQNMSNVGQTHRVNLKSGRPVANKQFNDEELMEMFTSKLRIGLTKINDKFRREMNRTDKYRTMLVRLMKRIMVEVVTQLGIDSYAKSMDISKFLPEFEKRFHAMKRLMTSNTGDKASHAGTNTDLDS